MSARRRGRVLPLPQLAGQSGLRGHTGAILAGGRHNCSCEARRHALLANCLHCGRIVCAQQGAGPCFTCGRDVPSVKSTAAAADAMPADVAVRRRDELLRRDAATAASDHSASANVVIDDQCDYFQSSTAAAAVWLNPSQRRALQLYSQRQQERRQAGASARSSTAIDLQLQPGGVSVSASAADASAPPCVDSVGELLRSLRVDTAAAESETNGSQTAAVTYDQVRPQYVGSSASVAEATAMRPTHAAALCGRVQDDELWRMWDMGRCISVRQPWATLLVAGLKRVEGRSWHTSHRGRLWVASAAFRPPAEQLADWKQLQFPSGCLLGCVTVEECVSQQEFRDKYPHEAEQCDAPYAIVCSGAQQLAVHFPVRGQHKIFELDRQLHRAAQKMLALG